MKDMIKQVQKQRRLALTLIAIVVPLAIIALAIVRIAASDSVELIASAWGDSGHADFTSQAFTHWHDDDPPWIPVDCARCHSLHGILDYLGERDTPARSVSQAMPIETVVSCNACHNDSAHQVETVAFPSSAAISARGAEARCLICHQGRESERSVEEAIEGRDDDTVHEDLVFIDVHYHVAAATLMGTTARGGYEYPERAYVGRFEHTKDFQRRKARLQPAAPIAGRVQARRV